MINNSDVSDFKVTGGEYIEFYIVNNKLSFDYSVLDFEKFK